jgi:hypothetical protein
MDSDRAGDLLRRHIAMSGEEFNDFLASLRLEAQD